MIKCPLCGNIFDEEKSRSGCTGCSKQGCGLVKCPNCQYEFPPEKDLEEKTWGFVKKIKKFFGGSK